MANSSISGLTALGAAPASNDLLVVVDVSDTTQAPTGTDKKATVLELLTAVLGNAFTTFTGPATSTKTFTLPNASCTLLALGQTSAQGTITTNSPTLLTATLNAGGVTFEGFVVSWTDTASGTASTPFSAKVNGSTIFSVDKTGILKSLEVQAISGTGIFRLGSNAFSDRLGLTTSAGVILSIGGVYLTDEATSDILSLRRSTNAQKLRVYRTYTDSSNYERVVIQSASGYFELLAETAGTGTDNIDLLFTPAGTGNVRFGTHSAIAAETVTGYITIKDAGGTSRKVAVVS